MDPTPVLGTCRRVSALLPLLVAAAWSGGCVSPETEARWSRHFDGEVWGGALGAQVQRPDRLVPEAALLATIPASIVYDDDIHDYYERKPLNDSKTKLFANSLQILLPMLPTMISGFKWAGGDGGKNFEVTAETLGGVVAIQQLFARVLVHRERPDHKDDTSFPSGHCSWAFAATTLLVRDMHDPSDDSFHALDALMYVPAAFNAWERIAIDHHWTSDVTVGSLLGVFWANLVWDAHFKGRQESRPTILEPVSRHRVSWRPAFDVIDGDLALGFDVAF